MTTKIQRNYRKKIAVSLIVLLSALFIHSAQAQQSGAGKNLRFMSGAGDTGSIVAIPDSASLDITNAVTLEAWVRRSDASGGPNRIFLKVPEIYSLRIGQGGGDQNVQFLLNPTSGGILWALGEDVSAFANNWIHIAATWNGSGDKLPRIYINGRESSYITQSLVNPPLETSTSEVWLSLWAETFNGNIDQARVWNVARTQNQIIQWMHKTENLSSEPGLVSVWNFNEGTGFSTADLLGLNNGTLLSCNRFSIPGCTGNSNAPQWQNSTAPFGVKGAFVEAAGIPTAAGPTGGTITANITSAANMSNNLGLYQFGSATSSFVPAGALDTFPFGVTQRSNIVWGTFERGSVTANLVFDYSSVLGIGDPSTVKIIRRTDANDTSWEVAPESSRNDAARTITINGVSNFHEYALGVPNFVPCAPVPVDLVSWWQLENDAVDARGGNNGILTNITFPAGAVGQSANFHGAAYITVADDPTLDFGANQDFTIEALVKTTSTNANLTIVDKRPLDNLNLGYHFYLDNGVPSLAIYDGIGSIYSAGGNLRDGAWHHVAVSIDRANPAGGIRFFVDGLQVGSAFVSFTDGDLSNGGELFIGRNAQGSFGNFVGQIDEVGIYKRAISASEVFAVYNSQHIGKCRPAVVDVPANVIGWWSGDGSAKDGSDIANHGTPQGAKFDVGKSGQAFFLDGASYVNIPHNPVYNSMTTNFTVEGWIKINTFVGDDDTVISKGNDAWRLQRRPGTNSLRFVTNHSGANHDLDSNINVNDGAWHHVAAVYRNGSKLIWIDGALDNGVTISPPSVTTNTADIRIGDNSDVPGRFFSGMIDEVTIYDRGLTDDEIRGLFKAGLAGKLKDENTSIGFGLSDSEAYPTNATYEVPNSKSSVSPQSSTVTIGDATITFASVTVPGVTQLTPLNPALQLVLPTGHAHTGLVYDISTTAVYSGNVNICFNLPAFANLSSTEFNERRILHLESSAWVNRTLSHDFANKIICAQTPSLSPFAIVDGAAPTAALVSIGGRVLTQDGYGLSNAIITLTDPNGNVRSQRTSPFGYYRFEAVAVGGTYILTVRSKRYQFAPQVVFLTEDIQDFDLVALP